MIVNILKSKLQALELEKQNPGCIMISMNSNVMYMAINIIKIKIK